MRDLIFRRVQTHLTRSRGGSERGAIGVLVAVLIGSGVLLGMGALVIDVGRLYQNRAELQNGADAAALAVAKSCVTGTCTPSIAAQYGNVNASNLTGRTAYVNVNQICGVSGTGFVGTGTCNGTLKACPKNPAAGTNYVDVQTHTEMANGSYLLPPVFARALAGNGSYKGSTVYACAQAEWGAPSTANAFAVTFSACTWDKDTGQGTTFAPPPPYPPNSLPAASLDQVILLHTTKSNTGCPTEPAGADAPGNFGWTSDTGNCSVTISNGTYGGSTGVSVSQDCADAIYSDWTNKTLVFLPVYTIVSGNGNNATYTLKGFAAFVITGYNLPGAKSHGQGNDWLNSKNNCKGSNVCINGYFTQGLIPSLGSIGGSNLGAYIVKLAG
jgi:Flp pilus assembly protein TadG